MTPSRKSFLAVLLVAALGASGCSTISKLNPFGGKGGPKEATTVSPETAGLDEDRMRADSDSA